MNIIERTKNHITYAKYRMRRVKALREMSNHLSEPDSIEFKYWSKVMIDSTKKCLEIPLR